MKRLIYLFLTLFTAVAYGQADFPEGVQISGGQPTTTTDPYITTTGATGLQGKVPPINMPVTITPPTTFYTPVTSDLKGHLQGIDNALGDIPLTTAGNTTRVWFTGDATTITAGTFYLTNPTNKGTVANVSQSVINDDNQKKYFTQDLIGQPFATATLFPPGVYAGNLSASTTPNSAQQRFTVELYKCDNNGTPIASGVSGAPVGDLGVTVILILDSGLLTLADGSVTNVPVSASLSSQFSIAAGERIRYHVSAEKVGTNASNITESVWYGNSFNSFIDVPTPITSSGVSNVSTVTGASVTNALDNLKNDKQNKIIVNVKDFGATGNGTTNDTAAINSAFAALPATGGVLYFPNGTYHSTTGYTFAGNNFSIIGESMPRAANDLNSLTGGVILKGQVLVDGDNVKIENIGVDFGINYSNTYRAGAGGNALVVHDAALAAIKKNITINNVVGLIRLGNSSDAQAAFHAILVEGIQFGSMTNVVGLGGWFGVVVKAQDFSMSGITARENDAASIYIKSNAYAPANRVTLTNVAVSNYTARGDIGVLIQASDAEMETISVSNVTVAGGNVPLRVESETSNPVVSFSLNGLTARNTGNGISVRGAVYAPVISNCSIWQPVGYGLLVSNNSTGQNAVDVLANNIRVVPSATTTQSVIISNSNTKAILSNINVAGTNGRAITAGSVIDLQADSDISNYVGTLTRAGVSSDRYRFKGGTTTTALSNISTTANTRTDYSNPPISTATGYLGSDAPYVQSYNNVNNTANTYYINPFGGNVNIGNLSGTGTRTVVADASGNLSATSIAPTSGTYTPTATDVSNVPTITSQVSTYTRVGNIVTVNVRGLFTPTTAATASVFSVTLPINRTNSTTLNIGSGSISDSGNYLSVFCSTTSTTTANLYFKPTTNAANQIYSVTFMYDITN